MSYTRTNKLSTSVFLSLALAIVPASGADLYVSTSGNDRNPGTSTQPFRTITNAYAHAVAGTRIFVAPGVYRDYTSQWGIRLNASGTASNPIVLKSEVTGGAVIEGLNAADRNVGFYIEGDYNTVDGFLIRNCPYGGISIWGNGNLIINNEIYHNGNIVSSTTNGLDGVYSSEGTSNNCYEANLAHDNGRVKSTLDHGFYLSGQNEMIFNNVLYRNSGSGLQIAGYTEARNITVYNNVMAWNGANGITLWLALNGIDIKNNILYENGNDGLGSYEAHGSGVVVDHNLCYGNPAGDYNFTNGVSDYAYTLGFTNSGNPPFINGSSALFNAHLRAGFPTNNAGLNLYQYFTTDRDGLLRPTNGLWDLGAYVHSGARPPPAIYGITNQSTVAGSSIGPLPFSVGDAQIPATDLMVMASSANTILLPNTNILLGGGGLERTVTLTTVAGRSGTSRVTLKVYDGRLTNSTNFVLTVRLNDTWR